KLYRIVAGQEADGPGLLELGYCIGLPSGIIIFFNHFSHLKMGSDPTPLQVQLRIYERDVNDAIIKTASREEKTIDV
ncbi:MAG: stage V sporulation protein AA, partial [Lachnospiraceae bacterium]|nr:stage V sporulation protein AA [Lachnospiraceae bacterium]